MRFNVNNNRRPVFQQMDQGFHVKRKIGEHPFNSSFSCRESSPYQVYGGITKVFSAKMVPVGTDGDIPSLLLGKKSCHIHGRRKKFNRHPMKNAKPALHPKNQNISYPVTTLCIKSCITKCNSQRSTIVIS